MEHLLIYEMKKIPDFMTPQFMVLYGNDVRSHVMEAQRSFLMLIHSLRARGECAVSLRYLYNPKDPPGERLSVYLLVKNDLGIEDSTIRQTIESSPIAPLYPFSGENKVFTERQESEIPKDILDPSTFNYCVEGIKEEAIYQPIFKGKMEAKSDPKLRNSPFQLVPYYFIHPFEPIEDNDMTFIDRQFDSYNKRILVEITVSPITFTTEETQAISRIAGALEDVTLAGSISISTSNVSRPFVHKDLMAEISQEKIQDMHEMLLTNVCFEFGMRVYCDDPDYTTLMADNLFLAGNKNGRYRLFRYPSSSEEHKIICSASSALQPSSSVMWNNFWNIVPERYDIVHLLKRFCRIATVDEISPVFRLIIPGTEPLRTIPLSNEFVIKRDKNGDLPSIITLGNELLKPIREVQIELDQLCKHMFITGSSGNGKTITSLSIAFQLYCEGVPFLVIEPVKTEYRLLKLLADIDEIKLEKMGVDPDMIGIAKNLGRDLRIYSAGNDLVSPLRINPFEFPSGITLYEHIGNLEACFSSALPINIGPLPALISEAIEEIYKDCDWTGDDFPDGKKHFPTMQDLYEKISEIFETKDYSSDTKGDIKTAIEVRIGSLLRGPIGRIFNTALSNPSPEDMMKGPVIFELDSLSEGHANLITMFLFSRMREYVRATRSSGSPLVHATILEEAHTIIGKVDNGGGEDTANPKVEATKYVIRALAELRALGECLIIVDQLPSAVAPEVIKNTNVKLVYHLAAADDREDIGLTMLMDGMQMEDLARLTTGQAYIFQEGMSKAVRINSHYLAKTFPVLGNPSLDNKELIKLLHADPWWCEGLFVEASQIAKGYENLSGDILKTVKRLILENLRLREKNASHEEFQSLWEIFKQNEVKFNKRADLLTARTVSFFCLMMHRSNEIKKYAEENYRSILTEGNNLVMNAFTQLACIGEKIRGFDFS